MSKTLHFKAVAVSRAKERPDNAVAACAYRSGQKLYDQKQENNHDYSHRGGVVQAEIFAPVNAPEWMKQNDWERFGNEIERMEDKSTRRSTALLAKDFVAAAPRELSHEQNWDLVKSFAKKVNEKHKLAVAVAFHDGAASDGGRNPHFHMLTPFRQVDAEGFSKSKYRKFDRSEKEMMELRRDYYQSVNEALQKAGLNVRYSPEKQDREPQVHKGKAVSALERKGVDVYVVKHNKAVQQDNLMRHFSKPSDQPQGGLFSSPLDLDPEKRDWNQQITEWQLLRASSMAARDALLKNQQTIVPPATRSEKTTQAVRYGAQLGARQSYVSKVQESRGWER